MPSAYCQTVKKRDNLSTLFKINMTCADMISKNFTYHMAFICNHIWNKTWMHQTYFTFREKINWFARLYSKVINNMTYSNSQPTSCR